MKLHIGPMIRFAKRAAGSTLMMLAATLVMSLLPVPALAANSVWQLDAAHSAARLFLGSDTNPESFNVGVARVSGKMVVDPYDPASSAVDLVIYPSGEGPVGPDGKLTTGGFPGAPYSQIAFKSTRTVTTDGGALEVTGDLTLTRVERSSISATPGEDYSGPIYGDPVVHTVSHEVTFVFPAVDLLAVNGKETAKTNLFASTRIGHENFPELLSAIWDTNWPLVVADENCQAPSNVGEDYAGSSCTGVSVPVISHAAVLSQVGEDYHGFEAAPPAGSQVTIEFDLAGIRSATPSLSAGN
jgi:polyisoprenoid-binding protein YceI